MKKIFLLLAIAVTLAACASNGNPVRQVIAEADTTCTGKLTGKTTTELKYGKDDITIKWKSFVLSNSEFRIKLKPKKGYEANQVQIIGKWGRKPDGTSTSFAWLDVTGSAKELKDAGKKSIFVLCVPDDISEKTVYKFDVVIAGIGDHDPRAEVVN